MKKVLSLAALMIAAMSGWCYDFDFSKVSPSGQNLYYKIVDGNAMVTYPNRSGSNYYYFITRPTGALVIPDTVSYNGTVYNVTSISSYAFMGCKGLTSVTIPDAVTSIGTYAFAGCELDSLTIGQGLTTISNHAFDNDTISYLNYNCPANVTERITKSRLATVIIGDNVTSIRNNAFRVCWDLTSVTIGNSVTSIGDEAFYNCSGLTSVIIPNSVTSIGYKAFQRCYNLTSVTIGNSVTSIGKYAFSECSGLTSITIPNSVTSIFNYAFSSCSGLTSIIIPDSVNRIDGLAFYCCTGLTSVVFKAKKCTNSGSCDGNREPVFGGCSNITSFEFDSNIQVIPSFICHGLSNITNVTIPDSVNSIRDHAFTNCTGLTSIIIPEGVTSIGDNAFANCTGLDSVNMLPATAPLLGYNSFYNNASGRVFILNGCSSFVSYDSSWVAYRSALRDPIINIDVTVFANDTVRGAANVLKDRSNHDVRCDSTAVISATANYGYHFDHWSNGRTANPDTITLEGDSTITAYFIGLTVTSSDNTRGSATHTKIGDHLDRITATPNTGYHFDHWSNGSTANPDTVALTGDITITAYFIGLTVTSSDNTRGSATHTKIGDHLDRITATPNTGYHFDHWSTGSTANPDTIALTGDSTVTAYFERNTYNLTVNVNNTSLGTVATPDGTSALYQDTLMVVATPVEHYHVASWQGQGIVATSAHKDTVWVQMLNNYTLTCNFAIDTHSVAVAANDIARGMVEASGTQFVYGTPCTVTATAYTGYTFQSWSNGVTANPYTFAVMEDVELTAVFLAPGEETFTVTVSSADPTMGSATVNGNTSATVMSGETVTLTATANAGYHFVRWNDDNTNATRTVTVTSDMSFTAYFEADGGTEGIEEIDASNIKVYAADGRIVVEGTTDEVRVYDMMGRMITHSSGLTATSPNLGEEQMVFNVPTSGVYLIKVGILPAKKVVVMKR